MDTLLRTSALNAYETKSFRTYPLPKKEYHTPNPTQVEAEGKVGIAADEIKGAGDRDESADHRLEFQINNYTGDIVIQVIRNESGRILREIQVETLGSKVNLIT